MPEGLEPQSGDQAEVVELFGPEELLRRHEELQAKLGEWSRDVVEANEGYNRCIADVLRSAEILRNAGIDTTELARARDHAVPPTAAINDYGRAAQ